MLILRSQTPIDLGPVAAGYLAIALIGAYFLSIGTFASILTKNQIVAAILAFAMLIPVFSAGLLESLSNDPGKRDTLGYFNLYRVTVATLSSYTRFASNGCSPSSPAAGCC